jgi:hypothetical protein
MGYADRGGVTRSGPVRTRSIVQTCAVALALVGLSGCGGGDDEVEESASQGSPQTNESADAVTPTPTGETVRPDPEVSTDGRTCDGIFSLVEIEVLLGEPAALSEETDESLGQLVCTWETVEDPENVDDVAFGLVIAQVYDGSPIDGGNFVDPSFWPDRVEIDGVGDQAFATDAGMTDFQFVDGQVAGTLSYTFADFGDVEATPPATPEQLEVAFRTMHERVMGG